MAEAAYARCLLLPPAAKNSRAGHVCRFAQLRTSPRRRDRRPPRGIRDGHRSRDTWGRGRASAPEFATFRPRRPANLLSLATRRRHNYLARSRPVQAPPPPPRSKTTEFRAAVTSRPATISLSLAAIARSELRTQTAGRENESCELSFVSFDGDTREFLSRGKRARNVLSNNRELESAPHCVTEISIYGIRPV